MDADKNAAKTDKAVALQFDKTELAVPTVVATGRGAVARQILDIAFAHGVKVREDADLVEILATLDVGDQIPVAAFAAIAEILSHIYRWELHQREAAEAP
ncbi:MAG TPA: EscU/YscU/HrcU family type III secretion system export apparatus switch protein [Aliidongia sp.]|nr:EscU/YscU/HrcU family type III secretion system export apparatus switch protein [Aliidongia sp.]